MSAATQKERRQEQRAQARRAILDATEALLLEEGVERFSIRKLVERCGYTAPTIYHHFGDKDGLQLALLEERFATLGRRMRRLAAENDDPVELLRATARTFVRFGLRNPHHYQLLLVPRDPERGPPSPLTQPRMALEGAWRVLWEQGRLRADSMEAAAQSLFCLCHGLVSSQIQNPEGLWAKTVIDDAVDALLRGLVRDTSKPVTPCSEGGAERNPKEPT